MWQLYVDMFWKGPTCKSLTKHVNSPRICDCLSKTHLLCTYHYFKKYILLWKFNLKNQPRLGWWQKLKQRNMMTQIVEFRVAIMSICTHKGPIFHYKAYTDVHWQWEPYMVPTAKLEPSIGTISPVMDLHGQQKAFWKSRPVDISQWRHSELAYIVI